MTYVQLDHPFPAPPDIAAVQQVAPGVLWIRMPLPFALDHINLWALDDGNGWTIVDTGVGDDETMAHWHSLFAGALAGKPVTRLICTHFHPDHMGLAGPLTQRFGIRLTATVGEWTYGRMLMLEGGADYIDNQVDHYRRCGYGPDLLEGVRERSGGYGDRIKPLPTNVSAISHGDCLTIGGRQWQVFVGRGHSPEHACLYCAELNVLISGDQILPRISPVVGVWPQEPDSEPLGQFLDSLKRLKQSFPADCLVLPSHRLPFRGLHERADELLAHHDERLERAFAACAKPSTALAVLRALFQRPLDPHQTGFAAGETVAHLNHLIAQGRLVRTEDADGVWIYQTA
ncbi:MBL fold metallo-hydrolase [Magnetospirillum sulfuroxidans]|uniref:MBL fold metallo-hydrolase n=1 Tax=Magnetospirillum sulfuroxidans TaxID=611300 RepID=UPI0031FECCF2